MASKPDKHIIEKLMTPNECSFTNEGAVCSPRHLVDRMKDFIIDKRGSLDTTIRTPEHIVQNIKSMLDCESESCIFKRKEFLEFAKLNNIDSILDEFFKPKGPANSFALLNNFNIDDVLDQFEIKFADKKFLHIPFQMRDFERIGTELASVDLADKFKHGYKTFGVVLNTDYSSGGGIHWFCLFGENYTDHISIEYFNSSGKPPLPEVQAWMQKQKHYLEKSMSKPVKLLYSTGIVFQHDNHSCGVYSVCYIWLRLEGIPQQWFKTETFNDKIMHHARKAIFRHS